ncbi:hypothetical protein RclHR1_24990002 [Rhizophagus clarus]|uniref:Integrase catalytic domain-containing protein n=1 Tax=Rhizophagus clarus TaxID=94130 RepID=A0A2Z6R324_9GLOM|nr:hypothetical protein RclHR1_24990002 [Rhizophagus clarus]
MSSETLRQQFNEYAEHILRMYYDSQVITSFLHNIECLKIRLLEKIQSLNDVTISFPIKRFVKKLQTGGRPKFIINFKAIRLLREQEFSWIKIDEIFEVSASTIKRLRQEHNIEDPIQPYSSLLDDNLDVVVRRLKQENPFSGIRILMGTLKSEDVRITRQRLQNSIRRVDAFRNISRAIRTITRRVYKVAGPNALWHIDGNHKLIRWKFVIHAGIDGYSRMITYIHCSGNNKSQTVFQYFRKGTYEFGIPSRIRADKEEIEKWKLTWNKHKITTEGNLSPEQLYTAGMMTCGNRGIEDPNINLNEYGIDFNGPIPTKNSDNIVIVDEPRNILTQQQMILLQS